MITIEIPEVTYTDNPNDGGTMLSDLDKFLIGFKKLCNITSMNNVTVNDLINCKIITKLNFDEGSSVGIMRLFEEIGFKTKE